MSSAKHISPRKECESTSFNSWSYLTAAAFGLLSSSCCVIQLVLNIFSVGCAGFSVLTPFRPLFLSISVLLVLYTFYKYGWSARAGLTLTLTLFLTATPEMVAIYNQSGGVQSLKITMASSSLQPMQILYDWYHHTTTAIVPGVAKWNNDIKDKDSTCSPTVQADSSSESVMKTASPVFTDQSMIRYEVRIEGMACEACASRLRQHFANRAGIERATVFFDDKKLVLWTRSGASALMLTEQAIQDMVAEVDNKYSVRLMTIYSASK